MRWHRRLVAQKRNFTHRRGPGRPGIMGHISKLIVRMAQENPSWGYTRIQGALANLSHKVGRGTIANVLKRNGMEPSPERSKRTTWSTFLKAHWKVLAVSDFLTVEVWTGRGLVTHYLLFVISLCDRVVQIAGITTRPDEAWMLEFLDRTGSKRPRQVNTRAKAAMMIAVARHAQQVAVSRAYYEKKRAQGKTHNQAIRALGRQLVRVIWSMLKQHRDYELRGAIPS